MSWRGSHEVKKFYNFCLSLFGCSSLPIFLVWNDPLLQHFIRTKVGHFIRYQSWRILFIYLSGKNLQKIGFDWLTNNKATGWLGALVRVTNLKFWFLRLRDKMLVFAGVVKKCLQHGHSFRLAGVWLKSENVRFACAVTRFCSSRVKKKH